MRPEFTLPSQLPTWPAIQDVLLHIQSHVSSLQELIEALQGIQHATTLSPAAFKASKAWLNDFEAILSELPEDELSSLVSDTIPYIAKYAISLHQLRPRNGVPLMLNNVNQEIKFDRRFIASMAANLFFSTFPKLDKCLSNSICSNLSVDFLFPMGTECKSLERLRCFVKYFDTLAKEEPCGHLIVRRAHANVQYHRSHHAKLVQDHQSAEKCLSPIFLTKESHGLDISSRSTGTVILNSLHARQEENSFPYLPEHLMHPEIVVVACLNQDLDRNELLTITNLLTTSEVDDRLPGGFKQHKFVSAITMINRFEAESNLLHVVEALNLVKQDDFLSSRTTETSPFSSKSGSLDNLAQNLNQRTSSIEKISSESTNSNSINPDLKTSFADRLKAALERGFTPDSEATNGRGRSSFGKSQQSGSQRMIARGQYKSQSSGDDSNYSFDFGLDIEMEPAIEDVLVELMENSEASVDDLRTAALNYTRKTLHKRALSDSFINTDIEHVAFGFPVQEISKNVHQQRWNSFQQFTAPIQDQTDNPGPKIQGIDKKTQMPIKASIEIMGLPGRKMELSHILTLWLGASLADAPLVIIRADDINLDDLFVLCNVLDQSKTTCVDVASALQQFWTSSKEDDGSDSLNQLTFFIAKLSNSQ